MNEGSIDILQDELEIEPELFPLSYIDDDGKEIKVINTLPWTMAINYFSICKRTLRKKRICIVRQRRVRI